MRTIKFRGQMRNSDGWIYGSYNQLRESITWDDGDHKDYFVYDETVGQYIGRKDKNGTEIYEHDILSVTIQPKEPYTYEGLLDKIVRRPYKINVVVMYSEERCKFTLKRVSKNDKKHPSRNGLNFVTFGEHDKRYEIVECEVISNIYDNPELIEK